MANIKSSKKRIDIGLRNNARNKAEKSAMKTQIKKFDKAVQEGNKEEATKLYPTTCAVIDKTASKGAIHKNCANRKKANLAKELNTLNK